LTSGISGALGKFLKKQPAKADSEGDHFEEYKSQILQRSQSVIQGLSRVGIRAVPLNTDELIELFYKIYNPGELTKGGLIIPKIASEKS
jgi:hypothetical protein